MNETKLVSDYLDKMDWRLKENSNMSFSVQGLNNYIASTVSAKHWLDEVYPVEAKNAHESGAIHIHDLGLLAPYCQGLDLKDLLMVGFRGLDDKVQGGPPKHFRSALSQLVNFFCTLQTEAAGAQAVSNFDTYLAPFIRADGIGYEEVKQGLQEFVYSLNIPTRIGSMSPFTNITMDSVVTGDLAEENVIIGGKIQNEKYKDFQEEMNMINEALFAVFLEGDDEGRPFSFPIPTYNITDEFNWDDPSLDNMWEATAKYGTPYFSNFVNSDMDVNSIRSMCPLGPNEEVLIESSRGRGLEKITIKEAFHNVDKKKDKTYSVYSSGSFVECKVQKHDKQEMIEVELVNGHSITMTKTHTNLTTNGFMSDKYIEIAGGDLTTDNYLPYSLSTYEGDGGDYDSGFIVGCFAGDGSLDGDTGTIFSLSEGKKEKTLKTIIDIVEKNYGARCSVSGKGKLITLRVMSRAINGLCRDFVKGTAREKDYTPNVFGKSLQFRNGVFDGHYATDGGNSNRIYTSSEKMVRSLNLIASTLGTSTNVAVDKRTKEDGSLSDDPIYTVRFYKFNQSKRGSEWYKDGGYVWFKIKSVRDTGGETGYCLEVQKDEPLFTLANTGIVTHNCRLRLQTDEIKKRGGGLFGANPLTGSINVVTINMSQIGYLSKTKEEYKARLMELMKLARDVHEIKRGLLEKYTEEGLYPYTRFYLRNVKARFGKYWSNHFNTTGIIGMNESCLNFLGKGIESDEGKEFSEEILDYINDVTLEFQKEIGSMFNIEAVPGEGSTYRLAKKDKEQYPDIIVANNEDVETVGADPYYTNSTWLPVGTTSDMFEVLDHQDSLQTKYSSGTVVHLFLGQRLSNGNTAKRLIQKITSSYKLPYITISPTFSVCQKHGYLEGEYEYCPKCDKEIGYKDAAREDVTNN